MSQSVPTFGKRGVPGRPMAQPAPTASGPDPHAAFFAAARVDVAETSDPRRLAVPRSFKAAFLAGLVVGCALVGFDLTGQAGAARFTEVASALGVPVDPHALLPAMILLGLIGGARAAATGIIMVHSVLAKAGWTGHLAYTAGGALASAAIAWALLMGLGEPPLHGWGFELLSGAGAGFFYRVFAGARAAKI